MKREKRLSPDQKIKTSYQLRTRGFAVLEEISNDRIIKSGQISLIVRDGFDYEVSDKDCYLILKRILELQQNRFYRFVLSKLGLNKCIRIFNVI